MARPAKDAATAAPAVTAANSPSAPQPQEMPETSPSVAQDSLRADMRDAILRAHTAGDHVAHGALAAIESALNDLKARAASVEEHLQADFAHIIERIKDL